MDSPAGHPVEPAPTPSRPPGAGRAAVGVVAFVLVLLVSAVAVQRGEVSDRSVDVLLVGDSIMSGTGGFVEAAVEDRPGIGAVRTRVEAVPNTGLLTPRLFDWQARARTLVQTHDPKAVVVLFIGNYTDKDLWIGTDGVPVPDGTGPQGYGPDFFREWEAQAILLTDTLAAEGATVDWVLPPPMFSAEGQRRADRLRETYERLRARRPGIGLIDSRPALGGPDGGFVWSRPGISGREVKVRLGDSVHLTAEGGRLVAREIAGAVAPRLRAAGGFR